MLPVLAQLKRLAMVLLNSSAIVALSRDRSVTAARPQRDRSATAARPLVIAGIVLGAVRAGQRFRQPSLDRLDDVLLLDGRAAAL